MRGLTAPKGWPTVAAGLYDSPNVSTRRAAESVGAAFGDQALYARMRIQLSDSTAAVRDKHHAIAILASDASPENLAIYLKLLDVPPLAGSVIPLLNQHNDPLVADALIARLPKWPGNLNAAALEVLSSRTAWAEKLLDAMIRLQKLGRLKIKL
jgi:hypothetical protein